MSAFPEARLEVRTRRVRRFLIGCVLGITAGFGSYHGLKTATAPPAPWIAEFPQEDDLVEAWGTHNTQQLNEPKVASVWRHYRDWFVVGREPFAKGRRLGHVEWFFINSETRRMVGPWRPGVKLSLQGFLPDGRYVGINTQSAGARFRILKFDPVTGKSDDNEYDGRRGDQRRVTRRICQSADCSTLAVVAAGVDEPLWVRFFDVASGEVLAERTFRYTGYPSGRYYRRLGRGNPGLPIYYSLSPDGSRFVVAQSNRFEVVTVRDGRTVEVHDEVFPGGGTSRSRQQLIRGVGFSSDGTSIVAARAGGPAAQRKFVDNYSNLVGLYSGRGSISATVLEREAFRLGVRTTVDSVAIDWRGRSIPPTPRFILDADRAMTVKQDSGRSTLVSFKGPDETKTTVKLRLRFGYTLLNVHGVPDSERLIVNTLHTRPAREAHLPFMRSILDALNVDRSHPTRLVEGIWQYEPRHRKWNLIRQLTRSKVGSPTQVAVQPGRIGLVMKREGRYRFEVWPLPRYTVEWVRPAAIAVGCGVLLFTVFWPRRRDGSVPTSSDTG